MEGIPVTNPLTVASAQAQTRTDGAPPLWPCLALAFAATCITVGIMWDISWHETIGRDTFWTPAHMTIYLGGALGGCVGGWLAIEHTFFRRDAESSSVRVLGARAPLGAWVAIWGALAMLTSAPFDNWWHNAYGLDVRIISPPHSILGIGMASICFAALLTVLTRQNRLQDGRGSGLFIYVAGVFLVMAGVFIMEYSFPNQQHAPMFYIVACLVFPVRLVIVGRAAKASWPATRMAVLYFLFAGAMAWILPLFPGRPRLAPIFNPVTHMVPPPFPLLLAAPAVAMDLIMKKLDWTGGWKKIPMALVLATVFLAVFLAAQWFFAEFLLSPRAQNWFFVGDRVWDYGEHPGSWMREFWDSGLSAKGLATAWIFAGINCWLGLLLGGWMRKVQR